VTIDPANGNRDPATVAFLMVDDTGELHVDADWASAAGAPYWDTLKPHRLMTRRRPPR
jgi:hypothetical protein